MSTGHYPDEEPVVVKLLNTLSVVRGGRLHDVLADPSELRRGCAMRPPGRT